LIVYLLFFKPLESPFAVRMEIMNECTILSLTYMLMCFSEFVPEAVTRSVIGYFYIGVTVANILIHLIFLVLASRQKLRLVCKKYRWC